ncbi:hypothetical protein NLI96_g7305 [Meripilus lineatus]|uniref:DUF1996 domain-containing protein n=1 Tax=Meripilus lineatus TaxID=2056292 RepID=A0AAD5YHD6_9APHY|nr:hypothetical protein NLI96_g7305 [Physisporinus lineatus]
MVFSSKLRVPAALSVLAAALPLASATHWIFGGTRPVVNTRLDPIVNPGTVSSHVHTVAGASGFSPNYDYNALVNSKCSTISVPQDKSNYWTPLLYHYDKNNNSFTAMPNSFNIYYLVRGDASEQVKAIPKGLRASTFSYRTHIPGLSVCVRWLLEIPTGVHTTLRTLRIKP